MLHCTGPRNLRMRKMSSVLVVSCCRRLLCPLPVCLVARFVASRSHALAGFKANLDLDRDRGSRAQQGLDLPRRRGMSSDMKRFVKEIGKLGRAKQIDDAMDLLDEMKASHLPPNAVVYNSLISELARQGEVKKSFKLYNRMKKHGIVPTERTYSSLFAACSQAAPQGREQLDKLVKEISSKDIQLSLITLNAAIRALASHKNTPEALAMLDKMDEQYGIPPDVQSFTFALQACCQDQEDGASLAQIVWNDMESRGVKPDIYVYNEFIRAFRVAAYLTQSDTGYSSPLIPFGGIRATIKHMKRNKVKPDIRTFHELSGVVDGDGKAETELKVVMTDCHIKPDVLFMNAAIQRKAKTGSLDLAYSVYERMISEGLEPNVASVQALAHGCQTEKDAVRVLTTAMDSNIRPIESIFCSLLRVGARSHNYKYLISLIKLLDHYKIYPSEDIIAILDNIATEKPWEKKVKARKRFHFLQNKEGFRGYLKIWKHEHGYD